MEHYLSTYDYVSYCMVNVALDFDVLDELYDVMKSNCRLNHLADPKNFNYSKRPSARSDNRTSVYPLYFMLNERYPNLSFKTK